MTLPSQWRCTNEDIPIFQRWIYFFITSIQSFFLFNVHVLHFLPFFFSFFFPNSHYLFLDSFTWTQCEFSSTHLSQTKVQFKVSSNFKFCIDFTNKSGQVKLPFLNAAFCSWFLVFILTELLRSNLIVIASDIPHKSLIAKEGQVPLELIVFRYQNHPGIMPNCIPA